MHLNKFNQLSAPATTDPQYKDLNDEKLASLLSSGNGGAFAEIYARFQGRLYLHAVKMLGNREEAQDVVQDIFLKLWNKKETLQFSGSLSSYLFTAVRNKILDIFSHEKVAFKYQESLRSFIDEGQFITDNYIREKELRAIIEEEIQNLPPKMKEVFELSRQRNMSYNEIAGELNIAENTVKKHITRALKKLKIKVNLIYLLVWAALIS